MTSNSASLMDTRLLGRFEDLSARLSGNDPSPIKGLDWTRACLATIHKHDIVHLFETTSEGEPEALAVMVRRPWHLPRLSLAGSDELHYTTDAIFRDTRAAERLAEAVRDSGLPVRLLGIPASSALVDAMTTAYRSRGIVRVRPYGSNPILPIDQRWLNPESLLSRNSRGNYRRRLRRAEEAGGLTFEAISPTVDELPRLLEEAIAVEAASWKGRAGTALASDKDQREFFELYAQSAAAKGTLRLFFLRIGGVAAAMRLAVVHEGALWLLKIGYNEEFRRMAPGVLLLFETARYAAREGLTALECLGDYGEWLSPELLLHEETVVVDAYPATLAGGVVLGADAILSLARRAARRVGFPKQAER